MSAAPLRVLVIDDEPPIRKLLRVGLSAHGYQIMEASSGKMALELLGGQPPDLIVLDLGLPDMQGHELLRTMRVRRSSWPCMSGRPRSRMIKSGGCSPKSSSAILPLDASMI